MPAKKKTVKRTTKKAAAKKTYVSVPCGTEITVSKEGMGVARLMCCGRLIKPKGAKKDVRSGILVCRFGLTRFLEEVNLMIRRARFFFSPDGLRNLGLGF